MKSQHICIPKIYLPIMLACFFLTGCVYVSKYEPKESPLATWDPSGSTGFLAARVGDGSLTISESCVLLVHDNQIATLLVWPEPTSWNTATQAIEYVSPINGERIELREGDRIFGGGSGARENMFYVNSPDPSCEADDIFILNDVRLVEE